MNKRLLKPLLIAISSCCLAVCAAAADAPDQDAEPVESRYRDCISQSTIRDYQVLDESNLIVKGGARRNYHVSLTRRAFGLRSSWKIGFRSPTGMICTHSSEIVVDDQIGGLERIRIRSIRQLSPDDLDALLVRYGKKEPEFEQPPAIREVEGAEVEELD